MLRLVIYRALFLTATVCLSAAGLDWKPGVDYRSAALAISPNGHTGFTLLSAATTGVAFTNHLSDRTVAYNRIYENGSGVALGDVDGDGLCDLYFCQAGQTHSYRKSGQLAL
jgi:hypothetical protein